MPVEKQFLLKKTYLNFVLILSELKTNPFSNPLFNFSWYPEEIKSSLADERQNIQIST